jgi:hypothetical protein
MSREIESRTGDRMIVKEINGKKLSWLSHLLKNRKSGFESRLGIFIRLFLVFTYNIVVNIELICIFCILL